MRKTIFGQFMFYILVFGAVIALLSYLVLGVYFGRYYYRQQQKLIISACEALTREYDRNGYESAAEMMDTYALDSGITAQLFSPGGGVIHGGGMHGMMHGAGADPLSEGRTGEVFVMTGGMMQKAPGGPWLAYMLETGDGNIMLVRISYRNMDAVISMVKRFILVFGIAVAVFFIAFAFLFSRSMSKPLRELNDIASRMGKLDFSPKYEGRRVDEIGQLGHTLNELTEKLENTISQLKGELSKEKTLEQMRTSFTAQVSHELQTPLSVIKGYAEALSDGLYTKAGAPEAYGIILSEAGRMSDLASDLLDMSQIQAGAYVIRKAETSLPELVEKLYRRYRSLPQTKAFDIKSDMNYSGGLILADPLRLEQAIGNVVNNAIKHVSGGGEIKLNLWREGGRAHISVFNTGSPISGEDLPHIFESYYQGRGSSKGSGLGLAITKHIIELHGGSIEARNVQGGVVFEIEL